MKTLLLLVVLLSTSASSRSVRNSPGVSKNGSVSAGPKTFRAQHLQYFDPIPIPSEINDDEEESTTAVVHSVAPIKLGQSLEASINETATTGPKTFRGKSLQNFDPLPSEITHDGLSPEAKVKNITPDKKAVVNNSTMAYLKSSTSTKLIPAIYIIVILIGIPANMLILRMLFSKARTVCTAIFYTNLAISDLLFCLMLPFKVVYHLDGNNWIFGETMCRVVTMCFYGNMYCSILLLMCISVSRYVAIVHPFIYRSLPKRTCAALLCCFVWITVLMFMIPFFTKRQTFNLKELQITCSDIYETSADVFQFYYFISLAVFGYLIPFAVIIFCYISIIRTLGTQDPKRFMYLKITILLLLIFALCFTPSNILLILHQVNYHYSYNDELYGSYLLALCFSSLNSCLDPFLYFLMSEITKLSKNKANETHMKLLAS